MYRPTIHLSGGTSNPWHLRVMREAMKHMEDGEMREAYRLLETEVETMAALDDLTGLGFLSFDAFLDDPVVLKAWRDGGSMGCIEIKRPHPNSAVGGGFLGRRYHNEHIAKVMRLADEALNERSIPRHNTVFYAFHRGMHA